MLLAVVGNNLNLMGLVIGWWLQRIVVISLTMERNQMRIKDISSQLFKHYNAYITEEWSFQTYKKEKCWTVWHFIVTRQSGHAPFITQKETWKVTIFQNLWWVKSWVCQVQRECAEVHENGEEISWFFVILESIYTPRIFDLFWSSSH